jgi:hypothetical protein
MDTGTTTKPRYAVQDATGFVQNLIGTQPAARRPIP